MSDLMDEDYYDCYDDDDNPSLSVENEPDVKLVADDGDPEYFVYIVISEHRVFEILDQAVDTVCKAIGVHRDLAKNLLNLHKWDIEGVLKSYDPELQCRTKSIKHHEDDSQHHECGVCLETFFSSALVENVCGHKFCPECWNSYLSGQVEEGKGFDITCMETKCSVLVGEDLVLRLLTDGTVRKKFQCHSFRDCVEKHPNLSLCPTNGCGQVFYAEFPDNKRVTCDKCKADFCFACTCEYHLPCDCRTIRHWWKKVSEDAETASYMAAHTKDCPKCEANIEKNGGCNHMTCRVCRYEFCWICMLDWKEHGSSQNYNCNKFSAQKAEAAAGQAAALDTAPKSSVARAALNKYLFYFQRWKIHEQSLGLEQNLFTQIEQRVLTKVQKQEGSLIDWQYLMDAGKLLIKCRRALQYTYAFAYYLEDGPKRMLFEHLQADLESGIENLSFSIERAETLDVAALQAQMRCAEFRRRALCRDAKTLAAPLPSPSS